MAHLLFLHLFHVADKGTQSAFLIDLPKSVKQTSDIPKTDFYNNMVYFLKASTLNVSIISKLEDYDFSKTENIAFVHTM